MKSALFLTIALTTVFSIKSFAEGGSGGGGSPACYFNQSVYCIEEAIKYLEANVIIPKDAKRTSPFGVKPQFFCAETTNGKTISPYVFDYIVTLKSGKRLRYNATFYGSVSPQPNCDFNSISISTPGIEF